MLTKLKRWLAIVGARLRRWYRRLRRLPQGYWLEGEYGDPKGMLFYAPLLAPKRNYRLYVPPGYDGYAAMPLLVMLHGCKQDPVTFAQGTRMNRLADREGFFVLYPEQRQLANAYRCWNWFDPSAQSGDGEAALIAGMVREVTESYRVDKQRIYVAGLSAGGAMASILVSCHGDLFAAGAVHSGLMFRAADSLTEAVHAMKHGSRTEPGTAARQAVRLSPQKNADPMPMIVIHGSTDEIINPLNADQVIEQFVSMASCADNDDRENSPAIEEFDSGRTMNGYPYRVRDYHCGGNLFLKEVLVEGMGHAWSGGDGRYPFNDPKGPDASRMIWDFVSAFRRRREVGAAAETEAASVDG